jgi:hypothetical protein
MKRREFIAGVGGAAAFQQTTGIEHFSIPRMILRRCNGLFYRCANGAEARRIGF